MGWILGKRFLLLNHIGRKTGLPRQAVLEVVAHDKDTNRYVVAVGFGPKSQWYQNVVANPEVSIQVSGKKMKVTAKKLPPEEAGNLMVEFARRYPFEARFAGVLGYEVDGSEEDFRAMGEMMTLIALTPR
jgi:deazaflavin-dependent oxidoreductase (nitroreductase family)